MITRRTFMHLSLGALVGHAVRPRPALAQTRPPLHIRVVHTPVLIFAPLYVATERGYFAQQGLETELT